MNNNSDNGKILLKIVVFIGLVITTFVLLCFIFQPVYYDWNNYDTTHDIYDEPDNTIEALFLGSSVTISGITPMELYENYGICAYNMGTEQQSIITSYYWLKEIYSKHSKSLKTVIIEASSIKFDSVELERKALDQMKLGPNKIEAYYELSNYSIRDTISYLVPLFAYHSRWDKLSVDDFNKFIYEEKDYLRGYEFFSNHVYFNNTGINEFALPKYYSDTVNLENAYLLERNEDYLNRIIEFCKDNNIELIFYTTPRSLLSLDEYKTIIEIANNNDIEFLDFDDEPLIDEINYNVALDTQDSTHPNYYGASKITNYFGKYLKDNYDLEDIRNDDNYKYLDKQLEKYHRYISNTIKANNTNSFKDFIDCYLDDDYTIFVYNNGIILNDEEVTYFSSIGLDNISNSYMGIIDNGEVIYDDLINKEKLANNLKSIIKDEEAYLTNLNSINIIIYDNIKNEIINRRSFNSFIDEGDNLENLLNEELNNDKTFNDLSDNLKKLYLYNKRCENAKISSYINTYSNDNLYSYLKEYMNCDNDYAIFLLKDNDYEIDLTSEEINDLGLNNIDYKNSYIGVIVNKKLIYSNNEYINTFDSSLIDKINVYINEDEGIFINDIKYSNDQANINMIVYDLDNNLFVAGYSFGIKEMESGD